LSTAPRRSSLRYRAPPKPLPQQAPFCRSQGTSTTRRDGLFEDRKGSLKRSLIDSDDFSPTLDYLPPSRVSPPLTQAKRSEGQMRCLTDSDHEQNPETSVFSAIPCLLRKEGRSREHSSGARRRENQDSGLDQEKGIPASPSVTRLRPRPAGLNAPPSG